MVKPRVAFITQKALALGFFSLLILSGCQQAAGVGRFVSDKGVKMEAFMPAETFMVLKMGSRDVDQVANLKTLNAYFPNDPMGTAVKEFNQGFKQGAGLEKLGLDYEKDILPILNEKSELLVAVSPAAADNKTMGQVSAVLAATLADSGKMDNLMQKQVDSGRLTKADYNGQTYFVEAENKDMPIYMVRNNDVAFVSTSLENLKKGLDNLKAGINPLEANAIYMKAMNDYYKPSVALAYGDFAKVVEFLSGSSTDGQDVAKTINGLNPGLGAKDIQSETILLMAEKDGLRLTANVVAKDVSDFTQIMGKSDKIYLASKIPAANAVIYSEGSNLRRSYDQFLELAKTDPKFGDNMKQLEDFLGAQGLDLQKDVLTFLDKGFAVVLEDSGALIPTVGFYLDASGNVEGAGKVVTKINEALDGVFLQAKKDSPDLESLMTKEEVVSGKLWKFKLNLDLVMATMPTQLSQKLSGQKVEFYYGLLPDNTMVLALAPDLEKNYGKGQTVDQGQEYKNAVGYLNGADRSVGYVSPSQAMVFLDRVEALAKDLGTDLGATGIDQLKAYLTPMKSFTFGSKVLDKTHIRSDVFLHIGQ